MRKFWLMIIVGITLPAIAEEKADAKTSVNGKVYIGTTTRASHTGENIDFIYQTQDPRLGTNSGNQYSSIAEYTSTDALAQYGASLNVQIQKKHRLGISLEGKHNWKRISGTRQETIRDQVGTAVSQVSGPNNHPLDQTNKILASLSYTYSTPRPGDSLKIAYRYQWDYLASTFEQQVSDRSGWSLYSTNTLDQQINEQKHHANMDYACRIARGHTLDMGIAYNRRQIDDHTLQIWDQHSHLEANYQHLTQYAAVYARYRMLLGPILASVGLEYRATKMQQRWLHDAIPTAMARYQIDSVHALLGNYRMLIIRPDYSQMDTTIIVDAYTRSFGNDALIGVHVHNMGLTYQMKLPKITFASDLRYITTNDGLNALWMERNNVRIYTWGNEGIRHAVSLSPSINSQLGSTTRLKWVASVLWDERVARAISMSNANWGFSTKLQLEQTLPYNMAIAVHGDYAYHNTLDLYSYSGHGGQIGMHWDMSFLQQHNLKLHVGYTCRFIPDIHITQGAYTGILSYHAACTHLAEIQIGYTF